MQLGARILGQRAQAQRAHRQISYFGYSSARCPLHKGHRRWRGLFGPHSLAKHDYSSIASDFRALKFFFPFFHLALASKSQVGRVTQISI